MKELKSFENEIFKCSRCGICQGVCPIFEVEKSECVISRGKFNMLFGVLKGDLKFDKTISKHLDNCLNCGACAEFCPSGIDPCEIFSAAKYETKKLAKPCIIKNLVFSPGFMKLCMRVSSIFIKIYRVLRLDHLRFPPFSLINPLLKINSKRKKQNSTCVKTSTAVYFEGCMTKYVNPSIKNASLNLLDSLGINVLSPDLDCCGIMFLASGDLDSVKKLAEKNLGKIDEKADYIVFDCESCLFMFREYAKLLQEPLKSKLEILLEKSILLTELFENHPLKSEKNLKITYHKPCHQKKLPNLLSKIENIDYIEAENYNKCCGFSGFFALKHNKITKTLTEKKATEMAKTDADFILTACPSCVFGLHTGQAQLNQKNQKILNIIEFLDKIN